MKYFTIDELTSSVTAENHNIDNTPDEESLKQLEKLVTDILDPLRESIGSPVIVNSAYRSKKLNKKIGGSKKSQHLYGQAADIRSNKYSPVELAFQLLKILDKWNQLIIYPSFVHVANVRSDGSGDCEILKKSGKKYYKTTRQFIEKMVT